MTEILLKTIFTLLQSSEVDAEGLSREDLALVLEDYGFKPNKINHLLDWISDLSDISKDNGGLITSNGIRVFTNEELDLIDITFLNYIIKLERTGIINANQRETIVTQLQKIDNYGFSIETKQLVISMIIFGESYFGSASQFEAKLSELQSMGHLN
jgi:Smg protein